MAGGEGGDRFQPLQVKIQGYQIVRTGIFVAVERAYATDIPLFLRVKESKVSDGIEGICSAPNGPDYVKLR